MHRGSVGVLGKLNCSETAESRGYEIRIAVGFRWLVLSCAQDDLPEPCHVVSDSKYIAYRNGLECEFASKLILPIHQQDERTSSSY